MSYIEGTPRNQVTTLPLSLEELLPSNHSARVIDKFVEALDIKKIGIKEIKNKEEGTRGRPGYESKVILKIILYGYSIGERSSRQIERMTYENTAIMWLSRDLHPDYRTIARYRQINKGSFQKLIKETVKIYVESGIEFKGTMYLDGTKLYANASDSSGVNEKEIKRLEEEAKKIIEEAERVDKLEDKEQGEENRNFVKEVKIEKIKEKIEESKKILESGESNVSITDRDAKYMHHSNGHGKHMSYNGQLSVDENRIILESDVVNECKDSGELMKERVKGVEGNIGKGVNNVVADSGFYETNVVRELMGEGKEVAVNTPVEVKKSRGKKKLYDIDDFKYEEKEDKYKCPGGNELTYSREVTKRNKRYKVYEHKESKCKECPLRKGCLVDTGKEHSRNLHILSDKIFLTKYKEVIEKNKILLKKRKEKIEGVIGIIKSKYKFRKFLLRGIDGVKAEWGIVTSVYNILKINKLSNSSI